LIFLNRRFAFAKMVRLVYSLLIQVSHLLKMRIDHFCLSIFCIYLLGQTILLLDLAILISLSIDLKTNRFYSNEFLRVLNINLDLLNFVSKMNQIQFLLINHQYLLKYQRHLLNQVLALVFKDHRFLLQV